MNQQTSIEKYYLEAAKDLKDEWLLEPSTMEWYRHVIALDEKHKFAYLLGILFMQVTNGGFDQYFSNPYGQFAFDTLPALSKVGANETYHILSKAISIINIPKYDKSMFVFNILNGNLNVDDEMADKLSSVNDSFDNCAEDLDELFEAYVNKHDKN